MIQAFLDNKYDPNWSRLIEVAAGEISNYLEDIGDYSLVTEHMPDVMAFSVDDFINCSNVKEMPNSWQTYLEACVEKYKIPTP